MGATRVCVLQCVAECCSVEVSYSNVEADMCVTHVCVLQCVALQCVAVCCSLWISVTPTSS